MGGRGWAVASATVAVKFDDGILRTMARLAEFKTRFRRKVMKKCGDASTKILLARMKDNAPVAKKEWGPGRSLKMSLGRKVKIYESGLVLWAGVGPRTGFRRTVARKFRFWRDKQGRIRKAPIKWARHEQPSRRAHLSEKRTRFMRNAANSTRTMQHSAMMAVLREALGSV